MVVVLSGGGTAGHITPALALAEVLSARGIDVHFAGTERGVESKLVPQAGIPFTPFDASGFDRAHPLSLPKGIFKIMRSTKLARNWFTEINPDIVVGFGGYVSIPVARAAEECGIPVAIHEQNSVMGLANSYLSKKAQVIALTYDHAKKNVRENDQHRCTVVGNPVRRSIYTTTRAEGREYLGIPEDAFILLVFGGSLGARQINNAVVQLKDSLLARPNVHVVHITGPKELDSVKEKLNLTEEEAKRYHVMGYQDHMAETLAASDAIISRAGASSLAEIAALAIPALLIPFPYATENHQTTNAKEYVKAGCAYMMADADLLDEEGNVTSAFKMSVDSLVDNEEVRNKMRENAKAQKATDAANELANLVMMAALNR